MRIGTLRGTDIKLQCSAPVKLCNGSVDDLRIHIPENQKDLVKVNFERKMQKTEKIIQPWKGKALSLQGKITLINALVIPVCLSLNFTSLPRGVLL